MFFSELKEIIKIGECKRIEFKATTRERIESALLNSAGGYIIFGVLDNGEITWQQVTARTIEEIIREFHRIDSLAFPEVKTVDVGTDRFAIVVEVPGKLGIYTYDSRPYIRYGPTTQIMPADEYNRGVLEKLHSEKRWENKPAPSWVSVADLDESEIQTALQNAVKLGHKTLSAGFKKVIRSLLNHGKMEYTLPEVPNSRMQKYKLPTV